MIADRQCVVAFAFVTVACMDLREFHAKRLHAVVVEQVVEDDISFPGHRVTGSAELG